MSSLFRKGATKKRKRPLLPVSEESNGQSDTGSIPASSSSSSSPTTSGRARTSTNSLTTTFADLGLCPPLVSTCRKLGFTRPTAVQQAIIPLILNPSATTSSAASSSSSNPQNHHHILTLSATGSGKTAAFALPLLHLLSSDPYGIYALVLTPTRELAKQIQQQIMALGNGSGFKITCALIIGGEDVTRQNLELSHQPNFVVATPGRCAELCREEVGGGGGGWYKPNFRKVKFVVLDEADRLLCARSGFERDVAECLLQSTTVMKRDNDGDGKKRVRRNRCRTLLFSATMTRSLASLEEMAGAGAGRLPLRKVVVRADGSWDDGEVSDKRAKKKKKKKSEEEGNHEAEQEKDSECNTKGNNECDGSDGESSEDEGSTPNIPAGLRQEYIFMPSRVREAYLLCAIRTLMTHGGRGKFKDNNSRSGSGWNATNSKNVDLSEVFGDANNDDDDDDNNGPRSKYPKAQSAIIFVPTCERCAHISGILTELGIRNVALHSLLSQNRRLASLGTFQSQRVRVLVATDVASRGLDVPEVDLVINAELPRRAVDYVHRVGRTARAGRRGRAISLVGERDVDLVHEAERISGRKLEKCEEVTDDMAVRLLGPVAKASRLTKMKLMDIGFDELVAKHTERKRRDRRRREKAERRARKAAAIARGGK
mmetsp:Transcript_3181/g.7027  ORF Transcript_3181/g.7027 Transcript_3181/m.7027 type:complete len:656 (+) Transcript_3181:97-2064(+)